MRKKPELLPLVATEPVTIQGISAEGQAVARINDKVVFVEGAVPGDVCTLYIYSNKKSFSLARMAELITPSPQRVQPVCQHFGLCGGCTWQHLAYSAQLTHKQQQVTDAFLHLGGLDITPMMRPIMGSAEEYYYRNRLDFACADRRWVPREQFNADTDVQPGMGFHLPGMFSKVLDIEHCHLQPEPSNAIRNSLKQFCMEKGVPFFNNYKKEGLLRSVVVRNAVFTNQWMVIVMFYEQRPLVKEIMEFLKNTFPQITSLHYVINPKVNDTFYDLPMILYSGDECIEEVLDGLRYRISPKSFFQTNSRQCLTLFNAALDMAALKPTDTVYDLYTGTGSLALMAARRVQRVVGIEMVADAVTDAYANAALNNISNVSFYAGDMVKVLNASFIEHHGVPDVVITDPPRAGMHPAVVNTLIQLNAPRIIYVSCNPATQARDVALLCATHYRIATVQPVDMFPHTKHVENIVCLERTS